MSLETSPTHTGPNAKTSMGDREGIEMAEMTAGQSAENANTKNLDLNHVGSHLKLEAMQGTQHWAFFAAYAILIGLLALSPFVIMPITFQMIAYSGSILYIACHKSIGLVGGEDEEEAPENESKDEKAKREKQAQENKDNADAPEFLSTRDAMMMPLISGTALTSLYFAYKYIGKDWVNFLLGLYLTLSGAVASGMAIYPIIFNAIPKSVENKIGFNFSPQKYKWIYYLVDEADVGTKPIRVTFSVLFSFIFGVGVSVAFFVTKNFVLHNIIAVSFSLLAISLLSLDQFKIGFVLLAGLFFYDIFFVFATPVMVAVAKSFDGPAKIIFPVTLDPFRASILGLGDIIIPGFFVAMCLRFDAYLYRGKNVRNFPPSAVHGHNWPKPHFHAVLFAYCMCLVLTSAIMFYFRAAQPALLYLCPGVSLGLTISCWRHGQLKEMWEYSESAITGEADKAAKRLEEEAKRQQKIKDETVAQKEAREQKGMENRKASAEKREPGEI